MAIDPKLQYCSCGMTWKPKVHHKIWMLIFGEYTRTCSNYGTRMKFKLCNHVVKTETKVIKNRSEVYRNG